MMDRDDELQRLLHKWEAPPPSARLDERVANSFRNQAGRRAARWLPLAAGILLAAGAAMHWHSPGPIHPATNTLETTTDATGYQPIPDGAITVVKTEERKP
jgi:hypothetical protein